MNRSCPTADQLLQMVSGTLSDPPAADVEAHVLECPHCQEATASMNVLDTFVEAVRSGARSRDSAGANLDDGDQARVQRIIEELSGLQQNPIPMPTELETAQRLGDGETGTNQKNPPILENVDALVAELSGVWSVAQQPDELGRLGGYRVLKLLGSGGMGAVFLAEDIQLRRRVALKVMRPRVASTHGAAERFLREARTAASVRHDHIVTIFQVGEERSIPFLAMEYLDGESLEDRLRRVTGPLPVAETIRIGQDIADGLAAAHDHGLIHRDIKPANVWLEAAKGRGLRDEGEGNNASTAAALASQPSALSYFRVKLLDFGLARGMDDDARITSSGMIVGTPSYMAPEQASGEEVDQRADLFSLGCVLYRMTTGRLPFPGKKALEVLQALANITPVSPRDVNPDVPQPLSDLIDRLLRKDRNARLASAREVARELSRMGTLARPAVPSSVDATTVELESKTRRRTAEGGHPTRRWWISTALATACVLFGVIIIKLRDKDGHETKITVDAPPGTKLISAEQSSPVKPRTAPESTVPDRRAAEWALEVGGKVHIVANGKTRSVDAVNDLPAEPFSLVRILMSGAGDRVSDDGLAHLSGLNELTHLYLDGTSVTDAGLVHVQKLTTLLDVRLGNTRITDAGLERIKRSSKLAQLSVLKTRVTDRGIQHLLGLTNLVFLDLNATQVSDAGLEQLINLHELQSLSLSGSRVTDAGIDHLKGLPKLTKLEWADMRLTEEVLKRLQGLPNLMHLFANEPPMTDEGLELLKALSNLTELSVYKSAITPDWAEKLRTALPNCKLVLKVKGADGNETLVTLNDRANSAKPLVSQSSALDALAPATIPASERFDWQPQELVAVLGSHAWRHWGDVLSVSSNPDGSLIASAGKNDGVRLWDANGQQISAWPGSAVAFSADGKRLVTRRDNELVVMDVPSFKTQASFEISAGLPKFGISNDANTFAIVMTDSLRVFDVATNKQILDLPLKDFTTHVYQVALSPDGKTLAAACVEGLKLWDVMTGQSLVAPDIKHVGAVTFSPDGTRFATHALGRKIEIWNLQSREIVSSLTPDHPNHDSFCLAFSRDGKTLASGGRNTTECWDLAMQKARPSIVIPWVANSITFTSDGQTLVTGGPDAAVKHWKVATGEPSNAISGYSSQVLSMASTPDGRLLAVIGNNPFGNGRVDLWDVPGIRKQVSWIVDEGVYGLAIDPKGTTLATAGRLGVRLWDLPSGDQQPPLQDNASASDVKFARNGNTLSAYADGNKIRSWQLSTGKLTTSLQGGPTNGYPQGLDLSPDGTLIAYGDSVWETATQTKRFSEVQQYGIWRRNPVFSNDGKRLLVIRAGDSHIAPTLYDTTTGELVESFRGGHQSDPACAIFLRDDKTIVSAGLDGQIIEWTSPRKKRVLCKLPGPVLNLTLAADGRHLFTANSNGTVYVLRLSE